MQRLTAIFGALELLLGIGTYLGTGAQHVTALIPALFGALLLICAALYSKEKLRMHVMHAAALIGLLGILGTISALGQLPALMNGVAERPLAVQSKLIMLVFSAVYLAFCVRSFIDARRSRKAA